MLQDIIKDLRRSRRLTQSQLAEDLHVSQGSVASWEAGVRRPDIDLLPVIAGYFGISVDQLLGLPIDEEQEELWQLREEVRRDPERNALFSLARSADIQEVRQALAVLDALKKTAAPKE